MSTINTNGLDVNYPIPGQNNSSQGFRNNFQNIKVNLDTAGTEITDLQNKVVLKSALANSSINNDMANTLISNASTRGFRATTYNLGNALVGTVTVNASLADVHYGNVNGNVTFNFGNWAPVDTQQTITLQLGISNANAVITFPTEMIASNNNFGVTLLENSSVANSAASITAPYGVSQINLKVSTIDCGNSLYVEPINRPYQATQIETRTPPSTGFLGDVSGTVCIDPATSQLVVTGANTDPYFTTSSTSELYEGLPVVFTGTSLESNVVVGNTYYIRNVVSNTTFTLSSTIGGSNIAIASNATGTNMFLNPVTYLYIATQDYDGTLTVHNVANTFNTGNITLSSVSNVALNMPVEFEGNVFGGLEADKIYYVKSVSGSNITVSLTRYNGIAGPTFTNFSNANGNCTACFVDGSDIFKRIPLNPF